MAGDSVNTDPTDWKQLPFRLVAGRDDFDFPAVDGDRVDMESEAWFLAGELDDADGVARYAFFVIFNKNRPGGSIVADFYTLAVFDVVNGRYGTFTEYDMPPGNMVEGAVKKLTAHPDHLDLEFATRVGPASWTTNVNPDGSLAAYTYDLVLPGLDHHGNQMELRLHAEASRPPVALGGAEHGGVIRCFGQDGTFSYFQTGIVMSGELLWGDEKVAVHGTSGHVDRQWFPRYAGGGGADGDPRAWSHEWRTISLDNGVDLSVWLHYDRNDRNTVKPFVGATLSCPDGVDLPEYVEDIQVEFTSFVLWPNAIKSLVPPPNTTRYLPDRHRITSASLGLDLVGEPLVSAPAHFVPIEYMHGPVRYTGTFNGEPVTAFAFYERSLALHRDWELAEVLAISTATFAPDAADLAGAVAAVQAAIDAGESAQATELLHSSVQPAIDQLAGDVRDRLSAITADLLAVVGS